ncbi:MAG: DMT family transporter, partial [Bacteroidales bacterium]|nr:DMT family transporter [Bacteroidales bacterium]
MWVLLAVFSAILLGTYDVAKKQALRKNGTFAVLLVATALSTLFVSPFLRIGPAEDHLKLALKAVLVTASWVSGMEGLKRLPLTTVSTIKGSRPVFVVLFSIILFGERLNWMQWLGIAIVLGALYMLGFTSRRDASAQVRKTGFIWMGISVLTGVA